MYAQNNGTSTFNYKKWQEEQIKKTEKTGDDVTAENLIKPTTLYLDGYIQAGKLHGVGFSIGGFYKNFNLEATIMKGLQESYQIERIYGDAHHYFTYRPIFWGFKGGFGITRFGSMRFTPQIGFGIVQIKGEQANETTVQGHDNSYVTNLMAGVRIHYQFVKNFGMTLIPEYRIAMNKSDSFLDMTDPQRGKVSTLSDTSDLKNWIEGFNCRLALTVNF